MLRPGVIERAYQLAATGQYPTVSAIKRQVRAEGYVSVDGYLQGAAIHRALRNLCLAARAKAEEASDDAA